MKILEDNGKDVDIPIGKSASTALAIGNKIKSLLDPENGPKFPMTTGDFVEDNRQLHQRTLHHHLGTVNADNIKIISDYLKEQQMPIPESMEDLESLLRHKSFARNMLSMAVTSESFKFTGFAYQIPNSDYFLCIGTEVTNIGWVTQALNRVSDMLGYPTDTSREPRISVAIRRAT